MTEKKIADPETAITFLEMEAKSATPTPASISQAGRMRLPDTFNAIMKDPKSANDIAHQVIDELRNAKR